MTASGTRDLPSSDDADATMFAVAAHDIDDATVAERLRERDR